MTNIDNSTLLIVSGGGVIVYGECVAFEVRGITIVYCPPPRDLPGIDDVPLA